MSLIHDVSLPTQWRHVPSELNPADFASRGIKVTDTKCLSHWLNGPPFLWKDACYWPEKPADLKDLGEDDRELTQSHNVHSVSCSDIVFSLISRFSKWYFLQVAVSPLLRYKSYLRELVRKSSYHYNCGPLKLFEIQASTKEIIRLVQGQVFTKELELIQTGKVEKLGKVLRGYLCPLRKLNPILIDGIIRVGGRLDKAPVSYDARHPMILPEKHHVTALIIKHCHLMEGHVGCSQVLATVRQKFWILQGPVPVKRVVGVCLTCQR